MHVRHGRSSHDVMGGCDIEYTACQGENPFLHVLKNIEESRAVKGPTAMRLI